MAEVWNIMPTRPKLICCLGIRDGCEYLGFQKLELAGENNIYGVDINPQVTEVGKNCYCHDFSHLPEDWTNKFDFIYSNSIDHAYDIKEALKEWHRIGTGYLFISFSGGRVCRSDIYSISTEEDIKEVIDPELFEIVKTWPDSESIHALFKIKK
jgi:hypothetical protein